MGGSEKQIPCGNDKQKHRAYLSRRYKLSAAHRLASAAYSEERNREVYGKCANPFGHGHNYVVEVTVGGPVDAATGMVCDLGKLDGFARTNIIERFDGMNLNTLEVFRDQVSTTENFAREIFQIFKGFGAAELVQVRVEETGNNSFEVEE
jgi:6-pyruvoyltetrahydropterin/6-carboxytetrahydropterin synthase